MRHGTERVNHMIKTDLIDRGIITKKEYLAYTIQRKWSPALEQYVTNQYLKDVTIGEIQNDTGMTHDVIKGMLRKHGYSGKSQKIMRSKRESIPDSWCLTEKMKFLYTEGLSIKDIAIMFNTTEYHVNTSLKEHVKFRNKKESCEIVKQTNRAIKSALSPWIELTPEDRAFLEKKLKLYTMGEQNAEYVNK